MPGPAPAAPLTLDEARSLFTPLAGADAILLAVSGGPDSTALMGLAAAIAADLPRLAVATVDHGLRPGSRDVAEAVATQAAALGLGAQILTWVGAKPVTRIQETARRERYRLLTDAARALGASHLVTAHTLDDQAETVLLRMSRGSGVAGLAGMAACVTRDGIAHVRPFLGVPKCSLVATCLSLRLPVAADASNTDPRFARARLRRLMPMLAEEGLDARRFAVLAGRMAEASAVIDRMARCALLDGAVPGEPGCYAGVRLLHEPGAVLNRALELMLGQVGSGRPRLEPIERLAGELRAAAAAQAPLQRNLLGVLVAFDGVDRLRLRPEPPRRPASSLPPRPAG
jgi:tRNA(Ile)-lysidine synthase